jgi:hypothetical protein
MRTDRGLRHTLASASTSGIRRATAKPRSFVKRFNLRLLGIGAAGIILLAVAHLLQHHQTTSEFLSALSGALIVAGVIATTVDWSFKTKLVKDAFLASFGYLLPDPIRLELQWLAEQELVCEEHSQVVTLTGLEGDLVRVDIDVTRILTNVTQKACEISGTYDVDDWSHSAHQSDITTIECTIGGNTQGGSTAGQDFVVMRRAHKVHGELTAPMRLPPGDTCTVHLHGYEVRHCNDALYSQPGRLTYKPVVKVQPCDGLEAKISFPGRTGLDVKERDGGLELDGALLPFQAIEFRWWSSDRVQGAGPVADAGP